jgi:hypothetical protein
MRDERKKIWIHTIQTRLLIRMGFYWLIYQVALCNFLFVWRLLEEGPGNPLEQYGRLLQDSYPALIGSVLLLPVMLWDLAKFAHRVVGPIYRFRKTLQALAAGQAVRPVKLRQDDFLTEMRDDLNQMLDTLQRQGVPVLRPAEADVESAQRQPA